MDWICYVFVKGRHHYLVPDESLESAWKSLASRQSMSVINCKKQYQFICFLNEFSKIKKL